MRHSNGLYILALIALSSAGCRKVAGADDGAAPDPIPGNGDERATHAGGETASATAGNGPSDIATTGDISSDTQPSSVATVSHPPVTIQIRNRTGTVKYLDGRDPVRALFHGVHGDQEVLIADPFCVEACREEDGEHDCCVGCEDDNAVYAILPDETVEVIWDGHLRTVVPNGCADGCGCYALADPLVGDYTLSIVAYTDAACALQECSDVPGTTGRAPDWQVAGASTPFYADLTTGFSSAEGITTTVIIEITRERQTYCDDDSRADCTELAPECDATLEVLALRGGCWQCLNGITCKPWGEAGCETDKDCTGGALCFECATTSCPACSDCIPACLPHPTIVK